MNENIDNVVALADICKVLQGKNVDKKKTNEKKTRTACCGRSFRPDTRTLRAFSMVLREAQPANAHRKRRYTCIGSWYNRENGRKHRRHGNSVETRLRLTS